MTAPREVLELIAGSGNSFHAKVARWFQQHGWRATISPYYMDQSQSKAREIDLIVEKAWEIPDSFRRWKGDVVVRLFVECKFVPQHSVFWFADKDRREAVSLVCADGVFPENNTYTNKHHYLSTSAKVAKVFSSNVAKGQELEPFYKALNQALNAFVSLRGKDTQLPDVLKSRGERRILNFPVVICSSFDRLWQVDFFAETEPNPIDDNFQLEVRYAYKDPNGVDLDGHFLLDFVEFAQLEAYVESVAEDAKIAASLLSMSSH